MSTSLLERIIPCPERKNQTLCLDPSIATAQAAIGKQKTEILNDRKQDSGFLIFNATRALCGDPAVDKNVLLYLFAF